jgi:hypothetical protein
MQPRKLTAEECTFTITVEADESCTETDIRGSFATDEPDLDDAQANEIIKRLSRGDETAWCGVVVTCTFPGLDYEGDDSIWGCTLSDEYTAEVVADTHGMKDVALDRLNGAIEAAFLALNPLLVKS